MQRTLGCGVVFESVRPPPQQAQMEPQLQAPATAVALPASTAASPPRSDWLVVCHPCICVAASNACVGSCSGFGARRRWWTRRWFVPGPALMFLCGLFGIALLVADLIQITTVQMPLARSAAHLRTEAESAHADSVRAVAAYHANTDPVRGYKIMLDALLRTERAFFASHYAMRAAWDAQYDLPSERFAVLGSGSTHLPAGGLLVWFVCLFLAMVWHEVGHAWCAGGWRVPTERLGVVFLSALCICACFVQLRAQGEAEVEQQSEHTRQGDAPDRGEEDAFESGLPSSEAVVPTAKRQKKRRKRRSPGDNRGWSAFRSAATYAQVPADLPLVSASSSDSSAPADPCATNPNHHIAIEMVPLQGTGDADTHGEDDSSASSVQGIAAPACRRPSLDDTALVAAAAAIPFPEEDALADLDGAPLPVEPLPHMHALSVSAPAVPEAPLEPVPDLEQDWADFHSEAAVAAAAVAAASSPLVPPAAVSSDAATAVVSNLKLSARLQILSAGVWHNLVLCAVAALLLLCLPLYLDAHYTRLPAGALLLGVDPGYAPHLPNIAAGWVVSAVDGAAVSDGEAFFDYCWHLHAHRQTDLPQAAFGGFCFPSNLTRGATLEPMDCCRAPSSPSPFQPPIACVSQTYGAGLACVDLQLFVEQWSGARCLPRLASYQPTKPPSPLESDCVARTWSKDASQPEQQEEGICLTPRAGNPQLRVVLFRMLPANNSCVSPSSGERLSGVACTRSLLLYTWGNAMTMGLKVSLARPSYRWWPRDLSAEEIARLGLSADSLESHLLFPWRLEAALWGLLIISLSLAVFNGVPLVITDGGKAVAQILGTDQQTTQTGRTVDARDPFDAGSSRGCFRRCARRLSSGLSAVCVVLWVLNMCLGLTVWVMRERIDEDWIDFDE